MKGGSMAVRKNSRQYKEFAQILEQVAENKKSIGERIIEELIFMQGALTDLKKHINEKGTVERFEQGKQNFLRESPALKSYNTTVNRYSQLYRQLTDLLPKEQQPKAKSELLNFINGD
jgi:hypothetical protein